MRSKKLSLFITTAFLLCAMLSANALFALVFMAYHDALETAFTSQYTYGFWRPITAIRRADEDGNSDTAPDANWESLLGPQGTPPHPSYASNASSASASLATILSLFYQRDDVQFQINFGGSPNLIRNYRSFSALTDEIARSRVYGGVHFPFDTAPDNLPDEASLILCF